MDEKETEHLIHRLMETTWEAHFTTIDENGFPQTWAKENFECRERFCRLKEIFKSYEDDFWIPLSTNTKSSRMRHMKKNPVLSAYYCHPEEFLGVMLGGKIETVEDAELEKAVLYDYWTQYPEGIYDVDFF